ncbi:ATP-dependent RNA helicase SUPV3L1/SUV3 [Massilia sp. UYP32]|uniref:DEAD/DEAH box helicase family protein n=1 Tax=Massilia timonae TaxID=47229 RepID=A0A1S2NEA6_9BURK|nr:helicase-related protein [Massilia timonae]OIJ43173.1 DEAD/DEAH box helicase family protein [Massilia timonae]HAK92064.1 RNA helicase [Massilia timonae]
MSNHHDNLSSDNLENDDAFLERELGLAARGIELVKLEGRVFLRFSGEVQYEGLRVPYRLVPARGVLAKPSKWRKMDLLARRELIEERTDQKDLQRLHLEAEEFVRDIAEDADQFGWDPMLFLDVLDELETSEPAEYVFQRISQRLTHAVEREEEERHAARTKESINLAEYPRSFEVASRMQRKFIALLGPTNSGKTHRAMEALAKAGSGVYLAPLRLLALENYERLQAARPHGEPIKVSLITGEERRLEEGATHVASTVEMLDTKTPVEVAVIDEIQMLADRDRGAAWTTAVVGAPANVVYLVGAPEARRAIEALAERLEVPLEVHVLKRMGPLSMEPSSVRKLSNLRRGDAVICFSRREVLMWRDMITEKGLSVATVYGNLSPEVRRAQAERFREGQADIVVGTDALAMGLNMPIARIVMTTTVKYNGYEEEEIPAALAKQIAGRAGRYGVHEEGFVAGYDDDTHQVMRALMKEKIPPVAATGFAVAPSLEQLHRIAAVTGETSLVKLLKRFVHNIDVPDGFFYPRITEEQNERAEWLDTLPLSVAEKFMLSLVPISSRVPVLQSAWEHWALSLAKKKVVKLQPNPNPQHLFYMNLQEVEDTCRVYSAYAWLGYREPEYFPSIELAQELAREASERVDAMLQQQNSAARRRQGSKQGGKQGGRQGGAKRR